MECVCEVGTGLVAYTIKLENIPRSHRMVRHSSLFETATSKLIWYCGVMEHCTYCKCTTTSLNLPTSISLVKKSDKSQRNPQKLLRIYVQYVYYV